MKQNIYSHLLSILENGNKGGIKTIYSSGGKVSKSILSIDEINEEDRLALESGKLKVVKEDDNYLELIEPFFPEPQLVVFGGGHIAKPLVEFGAKLGFKVSVVDDRLSFANTDRFPLASQVICDSFENAIKKLQVNISTFIVIVTRGHKHDIICLKNLLDKKYAYLGMIGSKRRVKGVMEQMVEEGYSKESLESINAPIGLDIGAITPEEIALSIMAEVVSYRRGGKTKKISWPEFDREVFEELSNDSKDPRALVTIISTKGSVPRKAGAKMVVWNDGRTLGSIGGGCSESEVVGLARDIISKGGYTTFHIDMTGQVAEDAGMVCGGTMEVIIESCT